MRSTSGSRCSGRDADGRDRSSGAARWPTRAAARSSRARISIARISWTAHGNPIDKRNAWQTRSLLYVRLIPPGAADVAHYRVRIPERRHADRSRSPRACSTGSSRTPTRSSRTPASRGRDRSGERRSAKAFDDRAFSFDPANIPGQRLGPDQGPHSRSADHHAGRRPRRTLQVGDGSAPTVWRPVVGQAEPRALERLGHRAAAAGRLERRGVRVHAGDEGRTRIRRRLAERGARAHPGRRDRRGQALHSPKRWPATTRSGASTIFKAMIEKADGDYAAAIASLERVVQPVSARSRRAQPAGAHPVSRSALRRGAGRARSRGGGGSRGSADALHGDAGRARARRRSARRAGRETVPALQGRRVRRRRSPRARGC